MIFKTYYPAPKFPPISLSGTACQLNCRHCNREYLRGMAPATSPQRLLARCRDLAAKGALGVLLSGGSTHDGAILNMREMAAAIRQVKAETGLIINIHPGLIDDATIEGLQDGVDFVSLEIPSTDTARGVFGLDATTDDYIDVYHRMRRSGMAVVPHISIYDGTEDELLAPLTASPHPEVIVVIVFTPTRDTPMADEVAPTPTMVGGAVSRVKAMFPDAEISLGCMRPRTRELRTAIELAALDAGAARMVLPSRRTLEMARDRGHEVIRLDACCALPASLEHLASHAT